LITKWQERGAMQPSDNPVRAKFAKRAFHALGRIEGYTERDARPVPHEGELRSRRRGTPPESAKSPRLPRPAFSDRSGRRRRLNLRRLYRRHRPDSVSATLLSILLPSRRYRPWLRCKSGRTREGRRGPSGWDHAVTHPCGPVVLPRRRFRLGHLGARGGSVRHLDHAGERPSGDLPARVIERHEPPKDRLLERLGERRMNLDHRRGRWSFIELAAVKGLHLQGAEFGGLRLADSWPNVYAGQLLVPTRRARGQRAAYRVQPAVEVPSKVEILAVVEETSIALGDRFVELMGYFFAGPYTYRRLPLTSYCPTHLPSFRRIMPLSPTAPAFSHEQPPLAVNGPSIAKRMTDGYSKFCRRLQEQREWIRGDSNQILTSAVQRRFEGVAVVHRHS
jgi:hypothetical protein